MSLPVLALPHGMRPKHLVLCESDEHAPVMNCGEDEDTTLIKARCPPSLEDMCVLVRHRDQLLDCNGSVVIFCGITNEVVHGV